MIFTSLTRTTRLYQGVDRSFIPAHSWCMCAHVCSGSACFYFFRYVQSFHIQIAFIFPFWVWIEPAEGTGSVARLTIEPLVHHVQTHMWKRSRDQHKAGCLGDIWYWNISLQLCETWCWTRGHVWGLLFMNETTGQSLLCRLFFLCLVLYI